MSGVLIIIVDLLFGIWAAFGKPWYWYILNFILLFVSSSIFNTTYIQCITRCYSVIALKGKKGIGENIGLIILTLIYWSISYLICRIVFQNHIQISLFFLTCLVISTVVAIKDNQFQVARERTKRFAEIGNKIKENNKNTKTNDIPFGPFEMMRRTKDVPEILKWSMNKHLVVSGPEFWGTYHIYIDKKLTHYILLPKADLTTHIFIGNPVEAQEWRKYDKDLNLMLSEKMKAHYLEWKIYKDYVLFRGKVLPPKDIPEEPYFGKIIQVEELPEIDATDDWLIEKIKKLYDNKNF